MYIRFYSKTKAIGRHLWLGCSKLNKKNNKIESNRREKMFHADQTDAWHCFVNYANEPVDFDTVNTFYTLQSYGLIQRQYVITRAIIR